MTRRNIQQRAQDAIVEVLMRYGMNNPPCNTFIRAASKRFAEKGEPFPVLTLAQLARAIMLCDGASPRSTAHTSSQGCTALSEALAMIEAGALHAPQNETEATPATIRLSSMMEYWEALAKE
jgi:hypothetical protein